MASNALTWLARSDLRAVLTFADQLVVARAAETLERRQVVDGLEQIGFALTVVAVDHVETRARLELLRAQVAKPADA